MLCSIRPRLITLLYVIPVFSRSSTLVSRSICIIYYIKKTRCVSPHGWAADSRRKCTYDEYDAKWGQKQTGIRQRVGGASMGWTRPMFCVLAEPRVEGGWVFSALFLPCFGCFSPGPLSLFLCKHFPSKSSPFGIQSCWSNNESLRVSMNCECERQFASGIERGYLVCDLNNGNVYAFDKCFVFAERAWQYCNMWCFLFTNKLHSNRNKITSFHKI